MKRSILVLLTAFGLLQLACYKDKGNYNYDEVFVPEITGLDTLYKTSIGDTLVVKPTVTTADPNASFTYTWRISITGRYTDTTITAYPLKLVFSFDPDVCQVRLTVADTKNGMKYFRFFRIKGETQVSSGSLVLSQENNTSQMSFVKPDGSVLARL